MENETKIDYYDLLILILAASGECNKVRGRTAIQKIGYFIVNRLKLQNEFIPHFYGPFNPTLALTLKSLMSLDMVKEEYSITNNERGMYTYSLTKDGEMYAKELLIKFNNEFKIIKKLVENIQKIDSDIIETLSYAAKVHFLNKSKSDSTTIKKNAIDYGWTITKVQISESKKFLSNLMRI